MLSKITKWCAICVETFEHLLTSITFLRSCLNTLGKRIQILFVDNGSHKDSIHLCSRFWVVNLGFDMAGGKVKS